MSIRKVGLGLAVLMFALTACDRGGRDHADGFGEQSPGISQDGDRRDGRREHRIAAPRGDLKEAELAVVSGATTVTTRAEDLGDDLYRVSTPDDSRLAPSMVGASGRLQLHLDDTGLDGPAAVQILLSDKVRWKLRYSGGANDTAVDLRHGRLAGLDFSTGSSRIEVALPKPEETVTVRMAGGASEFLLHAPAGVATRVTIGSGAGTVTVDGARRTGIIGGTVLAEPAWAGAKDRYDIDATAGVSTLTLDRSTA